LHRAETAELSADRRVARKIAGDDTLEGTDVAQAAAWTVVARAILSLDEFITRE